MGRNGPNSGLLLPQAGVKGPGWGDETSLCRRRTSGRLPAGTTAGEARGKGEAEPRTGWPRVEEGEVEEGKDNKGEGDEGRGRRERPIKMC